MTERITVRSADGTPLAVWIDGEGPPFVLVHRSPSEHTTFDPLGEALRRDFTTFAMDRRGAGASGDASPYSIEREFEDVVAVVDAAAARTGGPARLAELTRQAAAAVPNAHLQVLERHGHFAYKSDAAMVAGLLADFVAS